VTDSTPHGRPARGGPPFAAGAYRLTDAGNAERFAEHHAGRLLWVAGMGWLSWDGKRWRRDETNSSLRHATETAREIHQEAATMRANVPYADDGDAAEEGAKAAAKHAAGSESRRALDAMLHIGKSRPEIVLEGGAKALDPEPYDLNVANGILDLRTFALRPHDPAALCTRVADAAYREDLTDEDRAPWLAFLERILPDPAVRDYVQRAMGRALVGEYSEELMIPWGSGKNGKSTFLRAVRRALGDYAMEGSAELMVQGRGKRSAGEEAAIAEIQGRRFVTTIETAEGARLDETLVKQLTGESALKAKFMQQNPFEFVNQATFALATNHKPVILGNDVAIWARLRLVPFDIEIPEGERDKMLGRRLENELNRAVTLAWMVEGLARGQALGEMDLPEAVAGATAAYRDEMDPLSDWLAEFVEPDPQGVAPIDWVYRSYRVAAENAGAPVLPQKDFNAALQTRGAFIRERKGQRLHGKVRKVWTGLRLKEDHVWVALENMAAASAGAGAEEDATSDRLTAATEAAEPTGLCS
jgi:putative DNA primase/helicase